MKFFRVLLVISLLLAFVFFTQPSWAETSNLNNNPDYIELTKSLDELKAAKESPTLPEGLNMANIEKQITELSYQKYIMETASEPVGVCFNQSGQTLAIYGQKPKKSNSSFDNILYLLPDGEATDEDWDCQGVYLPNDVKVAGLDLNSAAAAKITDGTQLVITSNQQTGNLEFNLPVTRVFKAGDVNWEIPDLSQQQLQTNFPQAPTD